MVARTDLCDVRLVNPKYAVWQAEWRPGERRLALPDSRKENQDGSIPIPVHSPPAVERGAGVASGAQRQSSAELVPYEGGWSFYSVQSLTCLG